MLRILWSRGPSTVREVHEALYGGTEVGYTTSLKLLQNLHGKRLVRRDEGQRQHLYSATVPEAQTLQTMLGELMDRVFEGSPAALAMHALGARRADPAELAELKAMISRLERQGRESE